MTVSIVIPTYWRPDFLEACLAGLREQNRPPEEVIVVRRRDDDATARITTSAADVREVVVEEPGLVEAMTRGAQAATGEVIVFLDDDTRPRAVWLERLLSHFGDPAVGGASGRDVIPNPSQTGPLTTDVGRITRWGKVVGNHHLGSGTARPVCVLKGANMAFRREALALPRNLRGGGAQTHNEVAICLWARRRGWRLIYDPDAAIDHYAGPRVGETHRDRPTRAAIRAASFNLVAAVLTMRPHLFRRRAFYGLFVGDWATPGLLRSVLAIFARDWEVARRLPWSLLGQSEALLAHVAGRRLRMTVVAAAGERGGDPQPARADGASYEGDAASSS